MPQMQVLPVADGGIEVIHIKSALCLTCGIVALILVMSLYQVVNGAIQQIMGVAH